ncbi:MAG: ribose-5-phosphate isomerase [Pontimonas sp.]
MRIHLATDHAGVDLLRDLADHLKGSGHDVVNHGPQSFDAVDDYPGFCIAAAQAVAVDQKAGVDAVGIVLGGSGNGEQMAANKVLGVRAALIWNRDTAVLAREHNDANVAAIGARQHGFDEAVMLIEAFVGTSFTGDERHARRIGQIRHFETTGEVPVSGRKY